MAKTTEKEKQETALATQQSAGELATIPADMIADAGKGTESIGSDDVRPPRLLICQSGSPQRKPGNAKQIKGLNEMDMFNDLTNEIYGQGPLKFVVVKTLGSRHMQFAPMDEGGGVIDYDVPANDERTRFTTDADGHRVRPVATKFYDYLIWLPEHSEIVALSLKSTAIKIAIKLNGILKSPLKMHGQVLMSPPAWARTFSLTSFMDQKDSFAWCTFNLGTEGITDADVRAICSAQSAAFEGKQIDIPRESDAADGVETGDAVPF